MGQVIVITSGKGGVGKTTTTANLGTALAKLGKSVVLLDADIGLRNLDLILGLENRIVFDLTDVCEGRCRAKQAMIKDKRFPNLMLMPAAQTKDKDAVTPDQMRTLCHQLRDDFDYVFVDCPAGIEQGFQNAIAGADRAIIVTTPEVSAVRDADRIIGKLGASDVSESVLVINRIKPEMVERGDMMDKADIIDILAIRLLGIVPDDEGVIVSSNRGEPIVLNEEAMAGKAYMNIARRLAGEDIPLMDLSPTNPSFMAKLKQLFKS
jgi:septum site-determining protein MinD